MFESLALGLAMSQPTTLRLPRIFSDHMVLQQSAQVPIWGWDKPGQVVRVTGGWNGQPILAQAGADGKWRVTLLTPPATGNANRVTIEGSETRVIGDVMLGEVWVGSGQSNMEWKMAWCNGGRPGMTLDQAPGNPKLRMFVVPKEFAGSPAEDFAAGAWEVADAGKLAEWSAVGYHFGQALHRQLGAPVGVILTAYGGTEVELWMREGTMMEDRDLRGSMQASRMAPQPTRRWSGLWNAMVAPVAGYKVRGFLWYQGESNVGRARQYATSFPMMIRDWRAAWNDDALPFYFVQIAPFTGYGGAMGAELREAQRLSLATPHTGMVVTSDITDNVADIHPVNKYDVGERLARWAMADVYGRDVVRSGPLFRAARPIGRGGIEVQFDYAEGLRLTSTEGFEVAGADKVWKVATARVENGRLVVGSAEVARPVAVRYGWSNAPKATLFNAAGLPASSFTSATWPWETEAVRW